jgi:hypothetical protein
VYSYATANIPPVFALLGRRVKKAGRPFERNGNLSTISKANDKRIFRESYIDS